MTKTLSIKKSHLIGIAASTVYLCISLYLINYKIILTTLTDRNTLSYKLSFLTSLAQGSIQMLPVYEVILILTTAALVGINAAFIFKLLKRIKDQGKLKISFGGTSLLAVAGAGCPSCGISALSLLGITSSALPVRGITLQLITISLLGASIVYNYKKLHQPISCRVEKRV
jgi:hypothetical protein